MRGRKTRYRQTDRQSCRNARVEGFLKNISCYFLCLCPSLRRRIMSGSLANPFWPVTLTQYSEGQWKVHRKGHGAVPYAADPHCSRIQHHISCMLRTECRGLMCCFAEISTIIYYEVSVQSSQWLIQSVQDILCIDTHTHTQRAGVGVYSGRCALIHTILHHQIRNKYTHADFFFFFFFFSAKKTFI